MIHIYLENVKICYRELTDDDMVLFWALPDYLNLKTSGNISEATALNDTLILDARREMR